MLRRVIYADDDHMLIEKISETGTYIEFLRFKNRTKEFTKKI